MNLVIWLFLKEKLELNTDAICKISSLDCDVAHTKKEIIYYILKSIPVISPVFFIVGILVVIFGVAKWRKNQLLLDEQIKIEHDLKQASLRPATQDEIIDKYEQFRGKKAIALVLILIEDGVFSKDKYEELQTRLIQSNVYHDKNDRIKIFPVSQFMNIEASKMDSVLFG
ncbi:TPA: hypothetical protein MFF94_002035 [Klebsiella pneumoniae]|nr:hypothetical protein [Klebsiella pneumoniae]